MDSRKLTTSLSSTRNSSKQASLNMTRLLIGKKFEVIHVNQDETKTLMTKPMPSPKQVHYIESPGHFMSTHQTLQWQQLPAASAPLARTPLPPPTLPYHLSSLTYDLLTLQTADSSLRTMAAHISDPLTHPISTSDINTSSELHKLHSINHTLHLKDGVLTYVPEPLTASKLVVPHGQRGMMLTHAQNAPCAGHYGAKATYESLKK